MEENGEKKGCFELRATSQMEENGEKVGCFATLECIMCWTGKAGLI